MAALLGAAARAQDDLLVWVVRPVDTDPALWDDPPGFVLLAFRDPGAAALGRLFVMLPGTGGPPAGYQYVLRAAAEAGFHSVGLVYENEVAVNDLCAWPPPIPDCHERVRLEIVTGEDLSELVAVDRPHSIESRTHALLEYLDAADPGGGWGEFLARADLDWPETVWAGHSQGGGHAAILGKIHTLDRVALFSATEPAEWTLDPPLTEPERYSGFAHAFEPDFEPMTRSWENLGIPGTPTLVEAGPPPPEVQQYATEFEPREPGAYHGAVVVDYATPLLADGTPVFREVWLRMLRGPWIFGDDFESGDLSRWSAVTQ